MLPTLLEVQLPGIGTVTIHTYGVAVAAGCVAGGRVLWHFASLRGIRPLHVLRGGLLVGSAGFLGAKLPNLIQHWDAIAFRYELLLATGGGSVGQAFVPYLGAVGQHLGALWEVGWGILRAGGGFQAGFLVGAAAGVWYASRVGVPVWRALDTGVTALALGHAIGRLGCFAAGCCYGIPTALPWGVVFTQADPTRPATAPLGIPLHPTQLYEAGGEFLLFLALFWMNTHKRYDGQVVGSYLVGYSALRFLLELIRGDPRPMLFNATLSLPQLIGLIMAAVGLYILWHKGRGETDNYFLAPT